MERWSASWSHRAVVGLCSPSRVGSLKRFLQHMLNKAIYLYSILQRIYRFYCHCYFVKRSPVLFAFFFKSLILGFSEHHFILIRINCHVDSWSKECLMFDRKCACCLGLAGWNESICLYVFSFLVCSFANAWRTVIHFVIPQLLTCTLLPLEWGAQG